MILKTGITLVVSPLVSLIEDQVMALQTYNIDATMLNASMNKETTKGVQDSMIDHNASLKLLYVTPEKLSKSKRFMARLEKMYKVGRFARLVIDEVHCCPQLGHNCHPGPKAVLVRNGTQKVFIGMIGKESPEANCPSVSKVKGQEAIHGKVKDTKVSQENPK